MMSIIIGQNRLNIFLALTISTVFLFGCQLNVSLRSQDADMIAISHDVAKQLITQSKNRLEPGHLIVTSFANIDDLKKSSTFGRIIAKQIGSEFSTEGYHIIELLLRDTVYIGLKEGEFLLSRALKEISTEHDAQAVIVGTYAVGSKNVYVTTQLIRASDSIVLASRNFVLPLGPDLRAMVDLEEGS